MSLEYLESQEIDPDPKLLDRLNWSEDDLRKFVKRWKDLKQAAASGDQKKQAEYQRALESLGLGAGDSTKRRFDGKSNRTRNIDLPIASFRTYHQGVAHCPAPSWAFQKTLWLMVTATPTSPGWGPAS